MSTQPETTQNDEGKGSFVEKHVKKKYQGITAAQCQTALCKIFPGATVTEHEADSLVQRYGWDKQILVAVPATHRLDYGRTSFIEKRSRILGMIEGQIKHFDGKRQVFEPGEAGYLRVMSPEILAEAIECLAKNLGKEAEVKAALRVKQTRAAAAA